MKLAFRAKGASLERTKSRSIARQERGILGVCIAIHEEFAMVMVMIFLHLFLITVILNIIVGMIAIDDVRRDVVVQESRNNLYANNPDKE